MKEYVARHSSEEGLLTSRLPEFTAEEIELIKGLNLNFCMLSGNIIEYILLE